MKKTVRKISTIFLVLVLSVSIFFSSSFKIESKATSVVVGYTAWEVLVAVFACIGVSLHVVESFDHAADLQAFQDSAAEELWDDYVEYRNGLYAIDGGLAGGGSNNDNNGDEDDIIIDPGSPLAFLNGNNLEISEKELDILKSYLKYNDFSFNVGPVPSLQGIKNIVNSYFVNSYDKFEYVIFECEGDFYCFLGDYFSYDPGSYVSDLFGIIGYPQYINKYNSCLLGFYVVNGEWASYSSSSSKQSLVYSVSLFDKNCHLLYSSADIKDGSGEFSFQAVPYEIVSERIASNLAKEDSFSILEDGFFDIVGSGREWDLDSKTASGDISAPMPSKDTIANYQTGDASYKDILDEMGMAAVDTSTGTDVNTGEIVESTDNTSSGVDSVLGFLGKIWDWICSFFDMLFQVIVNALKAVFVPRDGFIEGEIGKLQTRLSDIGIAPYDMTELVDHDDENPFKDITIEVYGQEVVIVSFQHLPMFLDKFRPVIQGFLCLLVVYFVFDQFLLLFGLPRFMNPGQGRSAGDGSKGSKGGSK